MENRAKQLLAEAAELDRQIREQRKMELREKIFHPIKYHKKHKDDPVWEKYKNMGVGM